MLAGFADGTPFRLLIPQIKQVVLGQVASRFLADLTEGLRIHSSDVLMSIIPAATGILCVAFGHAEGAPEFGTFGRYILNGLLHGC